ncbi:low molecular weight protein-tyrosine-phosphatase [Psychrosphaera aestuarii]|uniref:low molecular weight protein-tyrosine-phosphatase n=1 Tax=Psychrosphaera aestuarii TaxID=1266052 RepID=UPI001B31897B|nr:low molecular weight protein-tyrosine-phosphatase [Psychrosphaera aestuarii]
MTLSSINSVLFVCLGNICRSPSAHAVFRHKSEAAGLDLKIDSAGTAAYHQGAKPDGRSQKVGESRGYNFSGISARKVVQSDFENFDIILAMDDSNFSDLISACPEHHHHKIRLMTEFSQAYADQSEVPDPYYGGAAGFEFVLDLIEDASDGLLNQIKK